MPYATFVMRVECPKCRTAQVLNQDPRAELAEEGDLIAEDCVADGCASDHLRVVAVQEV